MKKTRIYQILLILSCVFVLFGTTLFLVLPASTLNSENATAEDGFFLDNDEENNPEDLSSDNNTDDSSEMETFPLSEKTEETSETVFYTVAQDDTVVFVQTDDKAFLEDATLEISLLDNNEEIIDTIINSDIIDSGKEYITEVRAIDISFYNGDNTEIEPDSSSAINVSISADYIKDLNNGKAFLVHISDNGEVKKVQLKDICAYDLDLISSETNDNLNSNIDITSDNTVMFNTDSFSVYALVYTVDFEYAVNEEENVNTFYFSLCGGKTALLSEILEALNIDGVVNDVNFSDESLLKPVKADFDSTVYQLKGDYNIETMYSNDLSEEEIIADENKTVSAGDWALISLKPFTSDETLYVKMADASEYFIKVTDSVQDNKWAVTINLFSYDGQTAASPNEKESISGKTYGIMAIIKDKNSDSVLGYTVNGTNFSEESSSAQCDIDLGSIKALGYDDHGNIIERYGQTFSYNSDNHKISIRLYENSFDKDQWQHKNYSEIISYPDHANGFEFLSAPNGNIQDNDNKTTILNLKRAYDKQFNIRLNIDSAGLFISDEDKYYALVTVEHQTTGTTYAFTPVTVDSGQTIVDIPISQWYDNNGNLLPNEKFTGNETVDVKLYTTNKNAEGKKISFDTLNDIKNSQVKVEVKDGDSINRYNTYYGSILGPVNNDELKVANYYSVINFHKPTGIISKGDLDFILDDATDFGYYTERYIGHSGDIEATIGADFLDTKFEADFAYSSANVNVNRLKVLKTYLDENGLPVQKQVTIQLKQNNVLKAEKTGTTDVKGELELEFEGLGPGIYDIYEIIDGKTLSGNGSAVISEKTINYNFSISQAHFADNKNINYFGTIGENMDVEKLTIMLQKASRVDVVILTDTAEDKARIDAVKSTLDFGNKHFDIVLNGTAPYKKYDIKNDMVKLRQLSDDLANAQSSDTLRIVNIKASEISENGLNFDDDGRYIVLNVMMDRDTFCPYVTLDGIHLLPDYGQSGMSNSSKILFNLRNNDGSERYSGEVNTNKEGAGIILAPDANAHILGGPFGGTIITHVVNRMGNELHSNNPNQIQTLNAIIQNVIGTPNTGVLVLKKLFADNTKDKVTYFTFKVKLDNSDASIIKNKSFSATGLKNGDTVTFDENGEALILVKAGNSVSIANLPSGTTYTVTEIETPETTHFRIDHVTGGTGTITGGATSTATVYNITKSQKRGFSFQKVWLNSSSDLSNIQAEDLQEWDDNKVINVVIKRLYSNGNVDQGFILHYTINSSNDNYRPTDNISDDLKDLYKLYKYNNERMTVFNIPEVFDYADSEDMPYTYYVEEISTESDSSYTTYYGTVSQNNKIIKHDDYLHCENNGVIINKETSGYELPQAGGSGINSFITIGLILMTIAFVKLNNIVNFRKI